MANQPRSLASPPWKFSPSFGEFVYQPSTDQIIPRNGQPQRRPPNISVESLSHAIWEGFQYSGSPPTPASAFLLQSGPIRIPTGPIPQNQRPPRSQAFQQNQPRNLPGSQSSEQNVAQAISNCGLTPRVQANDLQTTEFHQNGQRLRHAFNPHTSVATLDATPGQIESQRPRGQGNDPRRDTLYPDYTLHKAKFFKVGRVFLVLWAEPAGGGGGTTDGAFSKYQVLNHLGERVFSKIRRFVVVREGAHYCSALPISTYNGQGVAKQRVVKSDHAIIYTGSIAPTPGSEEYPRRGEAPMRSIPIRVDLDNASEKLDPMSRINFGGIHMIQHNVKTKSFGVVNQKSLADLKLQFESVFKKEPVAIRPNLDRGQTQPRQRTGPGFGAIYGSSALVAAATAGTVATAGSDEENENDEEDGDEEDDDEGGEAEDDEDDEDDEDEDEDDDEDEDEGNAAEDSGSDDE
jgi:hypothetical protein